MLEGGMLLLSSGGIHFCFFIATYNLRITRLGQLTNMLNKTFFFFILLSIHKCMELYLTNYGMKNCTINYNFFKDDVALTTETTY